MNTEDDFWNAILAEPLDHHCVMVFADWLQDRGDPRAEGMRAIGRYGIVPYLYHQGSPDESRPNRRIRYKLWKMETFSGSYSFPAVLQPGSEGYNRCARAMIPAAWFKGFGQSVGFFDTCRDAYNALATCFPGDEMLRAGA